MNRPAQPQPQTQSATTPPRPLRVVDLTPGQRVDGVVVVKKKVRREQANGDVFLLFQLGDDSGQINAILWRGAKDADAEIQAGDLAYVQGEVQLHQNARQIRVHQIRRADPAAYDVSQFVPASSRDLQAQYDALLHSIDSVQNPHLRQLYSDIFRDEGVASRFRCTPAGKGWHHAYVGGLLEHVLSMLKLGEVVVAQYSDVDRDLVVGGVLLHDIGKIEELVCRSYIDYTESGRLVGHLVQGCMLVGRFIDRIDGFPEELRSRVLHMIVSHHGSLDRGSPKPPMTLEATVVHLLDHLDSQTDAVAQIVRETRSGDGWSDHIKLANRNFFRGRKDGNAPGT
jgi:3'-5' exoribonuclease